MFLVLSVAYGWYAQEIPLVPGTEEDPLTARTMPTVLAWTGGIASALLLILPQQGETQRFLDVFKGKNWVKAISLMVLMVAYGLSFTWLGFTISTILFLFAGIYLLGERRWTVLLPVSLILPIAFWALLTQALGIYLAPGELMIMMGVSS